MEAYGIELTKNITNFVDYQKSVANSKNEETKNFITKI